MLKLMQMSFASIALFGMITGPVPLFAATDEAPAPQLSHEQLDHLLAPIALYPDPLLAQILPASTEPGDVAIAARYVAAKKDPDQIDAQPWEESVKALAHYPDVLKMMDEKLDWTTALGEAFIAQPEDVFKSVQRLRAKAQEVGNLKDNTQQVIVQEKEVIKIMPADPEVVYVPQYPPETVYAEQPADVVTPLITFGAGLALGAWIHNEVDWHNNGVYYHNNGWNNNYHGGGGGNYYGGNNNINIGNGNGNNGSVWKPQTKPRPTPYGSSKGNNGLTSGNRQPGGGNQRPSTRPSQLPETGRNQRPGSGGMSQFEREGTKQRAPTGAQQRPATRPTQPAARPSPRPSSGGTSQFDREGTKSRPAAAGNRPSGSNRQAPANRGEGGRGGDGGGRAGGGGRGGGR